MSIYKRTRRAGALAAALSAIAFVTLSASPSTAKGSGATEKKREAPAPPEGPPPLTSAELDESGKLLFDAVVNDRPDTAEPFFFPREPFLVLKDVTDPGRYHQELLRAFRHDVHQLHGKRRSWDGVHFVRFTLGSPPRWTPPGHEWNKLGYYRTFDSRLAYDVAGKTRYLTVRTIISWEGRWYITHLQPVKH